MRYEIEIDKNNKKRSEYICCCCYYYDLLKIYVYRKRIDVNMADVVCVCATDDREEGDLTNAQSLSSKGCSLQGNLRAEVNIIWHMGYGAKKKRVNNETDNYYGLLGHIFPFSFVVPTIYYLVIYYRTTIIHL